MSLPKITPNRDYDGEGRRVIRKIVFDTESGDFRTTVGGIECAYVMEPNPHNRNGQPIRHMDKTNGAIHLTYYGRKIVDAIVVATFAPRIYLQLVLENGDQEPYTCESKEELEWFRKGLGFSTLDRKLFKV